MTATPEQDRPDRLAEIRDRARRDDHLGRRSVVGALPWVEAAYTDRAWLISEVERLRAVARRLLDNLQDQAGYTPDPGVETLCAIYEAQQLLLGPSAPPDELIREAAEAIAEVIGHEQEDDTPEGPSCDNTLGCGGHQVEPGCEQCASFGWPCEVALNAARAAFQAISPFPASVLPATPDRGGE